MPKWAIWALTLCAVVFFVSVIGALSDSSTPAPDAAGAKPRVSCGPSQITIDKLRARMDEYGYAHVTGRITNGCAVAVGPQLKITLYSKGGDILKVDDFWPASINNIPAGSEFPFEWMNQSEGFDRFTIGTISVQSWR